MKVCDLCKKETSYLGSFTDTHGLNEVADEVCQSCLDKVGDFLRARRKEYLDKAWDETKRFAKSLSTK